MPKKYANRIDKRKNEYKNARKDFSSFRIKQVRDHVRNLKTLTDKINEVKNLPLNADNKQKIDELSKAYKNCITSTVELTKKGKNVLNDYKMYQLDILKKALSKDMRALKSYEKKLNEGKLENARTFGELLDDARATKYSVHSSEIGKASAGQHIRAVIPTKAKKVYFTESKAGIAKDDDIFELKEKYRKQYGKSADFLTFSNTDCLIELIGLDKNFDRSILSNSHSSPAESLDKMKTWLTNLINATKKDPNTKQELKIKMGRAKLALNNEVIGAEKIRILQEYCKDELQLQLGHGINEKQGINPYSVQDKRNSAMSMVAGLLDADDVLCHSENANITIHDGVKTRVVKGTAMDEAKGNDLKHFDSKSDFLKFTKSSLQNASLIKSVAELQVLDYICGNCDRHGANLLYRFDDKGNLIGLQGIDNDSSFGALYKATGYKGTKVGPDSMSVIPASLAKKIMALDPDEFKLMLYGYDLTDPEADKAAERLTNLQSNIKASQEFYKTNDISEGILTKGMPRVVDDDKLAEYDVEKQLSIFKSTTDKNGKTSIEAGNLFGIMVGGANVSLNIRRARKNNIGIVDSLSSSITQTSAELGKLSEKMDDINGWYHLGSTQFDDMLKNCRTTSEYMRNFDKALIKPIKEYDSKIKPSEKDYELTDEAKKYREMLKQSLSITEKYINERSLKNKDVINQKKSSAGWKRYQFALENKDILTKQLELIDKAEKAMADNKELTAKAPELIAWETEKNKEFSLKQGKWSERNNNVIKFNNALEKVRDQIEKDKNDNHLIDMVNGKYRYAALRGMRACEETENRGEDIKDDPEQYEIYKKGLAASLIRKKIELTNLSIKNNDKNIPGLAELKDIDITNAGNPDKCIEEVMKTERFEKLLQNPPKFTMKDCIEQASGTKEADMKLKDSVVKAFVGPKPKAEAKKAL